MKKNLLVFALSFVVVLGLFSFWRKQESSLRELGKQGEQIATESSSVLGNKLILEYEVPLEVVWVGVSSGQRVSLYSNLEVRKIAADLFEEQACSILVNGGFYASDFTHIGLLKSQGKIINKGSRNTLFNGVFGVGVQGDPLISREVGGEGFEEGVQAGPVLVENGEVLELKIKNDELERRVVGGISDENHAIFLIFYNPGSRYMGPKLADLPKLLGEWSKKSGVILGSAINLDGGTASAFYTNDVSFSEIRNIGSYFCVE